MRGGLDIGGVCVHVYFSVMLQRLGILLHFSCKKVYTLYNLTTTDLYTIIL
jgi:hypothetical protein